MVDEERKREVLVLADEVGVLEAARRSGVKASTLKSWRRRARAASASGGTVESSPAMAPGSSLSVAGSAEELVMMGRAMLATAQDAQRAAKRQIKLGKSTGVKDLSLAVGILLDQATKLEAAATTLQEKSGESDGRQLVLLVERLKGFLFEGGLDSAAEPWAALIERWFVGPKPAGVLAGPARSLPAPNPAPDAPLPRAGSDEEGVVDAEVVPEQPVVEDESVAGDEAVVDAGTASEPEAAEVAERAAAAQAPRRVSSARHTPLPRGWEHGGTHGGHGRGRGPAGTAGGW